MIGWISILVILGGMFLARNIMMEADKNLSNEEKAKLSEIYPEQARSRSRLIVGFMIVFVIAWLNSSSLYMALVGDAAILLFIFYSIARSINTYKKIKISLPATYLHAYKIATLMNAITIFIVILLFLSPTFVDIYQSGHAKVASLDSECVDVSIMQNVINSKKPGDTFVKKDGYNRDWIIKIPSSLASSPIITEFFVAYWSPANANVVCSYKISGSNDLITLSSSFPVQKPMSSFWMLDADGAMICKDKKVNCRFKFS